MSFGKKPELNFPPSNFIPLLEENVTNRVNSINEKVFELNKITEDLKDFSNKLNKMKMEEFAILKPNIYNKISEFPKILDEIQETISSLRKVDLRDPKLQAFVKDKIRIIEEKIISKNQEFRRLVNYIVEKEKDFFNNYKNDIERISNASSYKKDLEKINESQIILQTVVNNKEYLEQRDKELAEIKKISGQILSQTQAMSADVQKQKEALGSIEDNVIEVNMNAKLAENEIRDAETMTRRSSRKIVWLSILLLFVIISIIVIAVLLFLPGDKDKNL